MTARILLLAAVVAFANSTNALIAQEDHSNNLSKTDAVSEKPKPGQRLGDKPMKPTHDEIVKWMNAYFEEYNVSAQDANKVHRMDTYFAPDFTFIPYMYVFGGPQSAITGRDSFYTMLTNHPSDYERFISMV